MITIGLGLAAIMLGFGWLWWKFFLWLIKRITDREEKKRLKEKERYKNL
jgi:hypothetical protein